MAARRHRWTWAASAAVAAAALNACTGTTTQTHTPTSPQSPSASTSRSLSYPASSAFPAGTRIVAVPFFEQDGTGAAQLAVSTDAVWATEGDTAEGLGSGHGGVVRIDPATYAVTASLRVDGLDAVAAEGSLVWASRYRYNDALRLDPQSGQVLQTVPLDPEAFPVGVTVGQSEVWVPEHGLRFVVQLDGQRGVRGTRVALPTSPFGPFPNAYGFGTVWQHSGETVFRIQPRTGAITARITPGPDISCCVVWAFSRTLAWGGSDDQVTAFDPTTNRIVANYQLGDRSVLGMAADGDSVWFMTIDGVRRPLPSSHGRLVHLSATGQVLAEYDLGAGAGYGGMAVSSGTIWVAGGPGDHDLLAIPG